MFILLFSLFVIFSSSQLSPWSIVNSSLSSFVAVGYDEKGIFSNSHIPGARYAGGSARIGERNFIFMGRGFSDGGQGGLSDVWEFKEGSGWRFIHGSSEIGLTDSTPSVSTLTEGVYNESITLGGYYNFAHWTFGNTFYLHDGNTISIDGVSVFRSRSFFQFDITEGTYGAWRLVKFGSSSDYKNFNTTFACDLMTPYLASHSGTLISPTSALLFGGRYGNQYESMSFLWEVDLDSTSPTFNCIRYIKGEPFSTDLDGLSSSSWPTSGVVGSRGIFGSSFEPSPRHKHQAWSGGDNLLYIFGGAIASISDGYKYMNDLWLWNHTIEQWAWINGEIGTDTSYSVVSSSFDKDNTPSGIREGVMWWNEQMDRIALFGGEIVGGEYSSATWVFSTKRSMWKVVNQTQDSQVRSDKNTIGKRKGSVTFPYSDARYQYIFSGKGADSTNAVIVLQDFGILEDYRPYVECSGHGVFEYECDDVLGYAAGVESCTCDSPSYWGDECEIWNCQGVSNQNSEVCGGHGTCIDVDECECHSGYSGTNCTDDGQNFYCFSIHRTNHTFVCSGHGECIADDVCKCDDGYYNETCDAFNCFSISSNQENVCSGKGDCILADVCNCTEAYYHGENCAEEISGATLQQEFNELKISYSMPLTLAQSMTQVFACSLLIVDSGKLGKDPKCEWEFGMHKTHLISITLGDYEMKDLKKLGIRTVSNSDEIVVLDVEQFPFDSSSVHVGALMAYISVPLLLFFIVFCCCICCCCCMLSIIAVCGLEVKKKNDKIRSVKHIDVILEEELAKKKDGKLDHLQINKELFEIKYQDIQLLSEIGKGGSGATVYRASWKGRLCAFKVFNTEDFSTGAFDDFEREVSIMSSISHPHVLQFFGCSLQHPRCGILSEICTNGDMKKYMKNHPNSFSIRRKIEMLIEIAQAMDYLHSRKIIHRDLKTKNVLLTDNFQTKVMDFGLSKILVQHSKSDLTRQTGTSYYMAPEVVKSNAYDNKCDVYSFSIMMYEVYLENWYPYGEDITFSIELRVANDERFRPFVDTNRDFHDREWYTKLMQECWRADPSNRPTMSEISQTLQKNLETIQEENEKVVEELQPKLQKKGNFGKRNTRNLGNVTKIRKSIHLIGRNIVRRNNEKDDDDDDDDEVKEKQHRPTYSFETRKKVPPVPVDQRKKAPPLPKKRERIIPPPIERKQAPPPLPSERKKAPPLPKERERMIPSVERKKALPLPTGRKKAPPIPSRKNF